MRRIERYSCGCEVEPSLHDGRCQFSRLCGKHSTITMSKKLHNAIMEAMVRKRDAFSAIAKLLDPMLMTALRAKQVTPEVGSS